MAKRRRKKKKTQVEFESSSRIVGLVLIIVAILAFGVGTPLGTVGKYLRMFSILAFGFFDWLFLLILFIIGLYMLFKNESPSILNKKFIGIVLVLIGVFAFAHLSYIENGVQNFNEIWTSTKSNMDVAFQNIKNNLGFSVTGSGFVGCSLVFIFNQLFDYVGTKIVSIVLIILGICIFTGFSIVDFIKDGFEKKKEQIKVKKEEKEKIKEETKELQNKEVIINDNNNHDDNKEKELPKEPEPVLHISSIDELKKIDDDTKKDLMDDILNINEDEEPPVEEVKKVVTNTNYQLPTLSLLKVPEKTNIDENKQFVKKNSVTLEKTLKEFGIIGKVVQVNIGPAVTQYELEIQAGTKLSKLLSISKEISLALAKKDVRIEAPIPGKSTVGIEVPNDTIASVSLREILENVPQNKIKNKLLVALGKNIMGKSMFCEIDKTPHLLVAGATGSGKSVCINCIITSILMRAKPDEVKLVLVDPKKVELSMYNGVPHLLMPVVTDPRKASAALQKIVAEMESRYDMFSEKNVKNIAGYNEWVDKENEVRGPEDKIKRMSYIVVIIDELADLMLVASKEVEDSIMRITQMARAAGIHLIVATQRPSTDVITGVVKANIPSRISFAVSSQIDSRTILDMVGAEKLLGKGDMLFLPIGTSSPDRIQGAYVSDEEIETLIQYTVDQQIAQYDEKFMNLESAKDMGNAGGGIKDSKEEYDDPLYDEIVEFVITTGKASASLLQRRFKLGYNRAARVVDLLEERGIIGPQNGSKPREVLVKIDEGEDNQ